MTAPAINMPSAGLFSVLHRRPFQWSIWVERFEAHRLSLDEFCDPPKVHISPPWVLATALIEVLPGPMDGDNFVLFQCRLPFPIIQMSVGDKTAIPVPYRPVTPFVLEVTFQVLPFQWASTVPSSNDPAAQTSFGEVELTANRLT